MDILNELKHLSKTSIDLLVGVFRLANLELQLAKKSLPWLISLAVLLLVIVTALWVGIVAAIILYLSSLGVHAELSLLIAIGLHVLLAVIVLLFIKKNLHNLTFPVTRKQLHLFPHEQEPLP